MNTTYISSSLMFSDDKDNSNKKSFAKEITESNKEIREEHRIIIQESIENDSNQQKPKPVPTKKIDTPSRHKQ